MSLDAAALKRLSALLDTALDLEGPAREAWLAGLEGEALLPALRDLLSRDGGRETAELLAQGPVFAAPADPAAGFEAGRSIGPYRLLRELGAGGMGEVWLAERSDGALKRQVALKLPILAGRRSLIEQRFARERDILASLEHPHIARLYDAGLADDGQPYLALEYVQGQAIDIWCREHGLPLRERLALLLQVADAVVFAHGRLVLHRDLKPANILVTEGGQVRLLDFGIAKLMEGESALETALTRASGRALTPDYASPEQIRGQALGVASDVYSLGMVAYELLAGTRPYRLQRGSAAELEEAILVAEPLPASQAALTASARRALRGDLDAILAQTLRKRPEDRYATVSAWAADLHRHLDGLPVLARPESRVYRLGRFVVRHRLAVGATFAVAVALVAATGVSLWQAQLADRQARRAIAAQAFLTDIFRTNASSQPDPVRARQTTARELLDIGATRLEPHLQADPEGGADLLHLMGNLYYDLGLDERAAKLYSRRVQLLKQSSPTPDRRLAQALVQQALQIINLGQEDEARKALAEAAAILDARGDHDPETRASLSSALAKAHRYDGAVAVLHARQAVALYRGLPDRRALGHGLCRLGESLARIHDLPEAEAALGECLSLLLDDTQASTGTVLNALLVRAEVQTQRRQLDAAEQSLRQALAWTLKRGGEDHVDSLHARSRLALFLHRGGRRDEAWRLIDAAEAVVAKGATPLLPTLAMRTRKAQMLLAEGREAAAAPLIDALVAFYGQGPERLQPHCVILRLQAETRLGLAQWDSAQGSLAAAMAVRNRMSPEIARGVDDGLALTAARLALAQQQPEAALAKLGASRTPGAADAQDGLLAMALRARALLRLQRTDDARAEAAAGLQALQASGLGPWRPAVEAELQAALGQALRAQLQAGAACIALARAAALQRSSAGPDSRLTREALAALRPCPTL